MVKPSVWLLQEGERVCTDRLFRVRNKQPFTTAADSHPKIFIPCTDPTVCESIEVGEICAFLDEAKSWMIGRVLQFAYYMEKRKGSRMYHRRVVRLTNKPNDTGVLCT